MGVGVARDVRLSHANIVWNCVAPASHWEVQRAPGGWWQWASDVMGPGVGVEGRITRRSAGMGV